MTIAPAPTAPAPPSAVTSPVTPAAYDHELHVTHRDGAVAVLAPADPSATAALDVLVETLCDLLEVDYAGVHLVDAAVHRVVAGTDAVLCGPLPRTDTLCGVLLGRHVTAPGTPPAGLLRIVEVSDTATDPTLPVVAHGDGERAPVRFYASTPLTATDGAVLGTLCVIAHHPRTLTGVERRTLGLLGVAASRLLEGCLHTQDG